MLKVAQKTAENLGSSTTDNKDNLIDQLLLNNRAYAEHHDASIHDYRAPPAKHLAVITCMDARLNPFKFLGIKEGESHIIRNGGGRLRDSIRSLVCSQAMLQTNKVMIIHHTDCGFTYFAHNAEVMTALKLKSGTELPKDVSVLQNFARELGLKKVGGEEGQPGGELDFMPIRDLEQSVRDDLAEYKTCSLLDQNAEVRGFLYDSKTGLLREISPTK